VRSSNELTHIYNPFDQKKWKYLTCS
jgi:hypothetical protein